MKMIRTRAILLIVGFVVGLAPEAQTQIGDCARTLGEAQAAHFPYPIRSFNSS